jgi:hypothetical protein
MARAEDGAQPCAARQAERCRPDAARRAPRAARRTGVVDDLEDAVREDEVGAAGGDEVAERGGVPLPGGDAVGDAGLGGAALEGGEGVGARVDDGDPVAELGERDGEAAGAAADVDDVRATCRPVAAVRSATKASRASQTTAVRTPVRGSARSAQRREWSRSSATARLPRSWVGRCVSTLGRATVTTGHPRKRPPSATPARRVGARRGGGTARPRAARPARVRARRQHGRPAAGGPARPARRRRPRCAAWRQHGSRRRRHGRPRRG